MMASLRRCDRSGFREGAAYSTIANGSFIAFNIEPRKSAAAPQLALMFRDPG